MSKKPVEVTSSISKSMISSLVKVLESDSFGSEIDEEMLFLLADSLNKAIRKRGRSDKSRDVKGVNELKTSRNIARQLEDANSLISILQSEVNSMRSRSQICDLGAFPSVQVDNSVDNPARLPSTLKFHQLHNLVYCRMFWNEI